MRRPAVALEPLSRPLRRPAVTQVSEVGSPPPLALLAPDQLSRLRMRLFPALALALALLGGMGVTEAQEEGPPIAGCRRLSPLPQAAAADDLWAVPTNVRCHSPPLVRCCGVQ